MTSSIYWNEIDWNDKRTGSKPGRSLLKYFRSTLLCGSLGAIRQVSDAGRRSNLRFPTISVMQAPSES